MNSLGSVSNGAAFELERIMRKAMSHEYRPIESREVTPAMIEAFRSALRPGPETSITYTEIRQGLAAALAWRP